MEEIKSLDDFWQKLPELAAKAGYEAGLEHLAAGYQIYYGDNDWFFADVGTTTHWRFTFVRGSMIFTAALACWPHAKQKESTLLRNPRYMIPGNIAGSDGHAFLDILDHRDPDV